MNFVSVGSSNKEMFGNVIDCLLKPVYNELNNKKSTDGAHKKDPMPGNVIIAGGGCSLGKASASLSCDTSLNLQIDSSDPGIKNTKRPPPVNNYGSFAGKKKSDLHDDENSTKQLVDSHSTIDSSTACHFNTLHVANDPSLKESPLLNPMFPDVTLCSIGGINGSHPSNYQDKVDVCDWVSFHYNVTITQNSSMTS